MRKKICIFWDSIVRGTGDPEWGGRATRLRLKIESEHQNIQVFPLGISGNTTGDLLKRFAVEAVARNPSLIILSWGINDSKVYSEDKKELMALQEFVRNYKELLRQAKVYTDQIICVWPTCVDETRTLPYGTTTGNWYNFTNQRITTYNTTIQDIAQENACMYVDLQGLLTSKELSDGLHPNQEWHMKIYQYIRDYLSPYLRKHGWFSEH